jgi:hypothetical protein
VVRRFEIDGNFNLPIWIFDQLQPVPVPVRVQHPDDLQAKLKLKNIFSTETPDSSRHRWIRLVLFSCDLKIFKSGLDVCSVFEGKSF